MTVFEYVPYADYDEDPVSIDLADISYRFRGITYRDAIKDQELIDVRNSLHHFDDVLSARRPRKMLTKKYLNNIIVQHGHYLEGACSPVPEWRTTIKDRRKPTCVGLGMQYIVGSWFNVPDYISDKWGIGLFRPKLEVRRPRKMLTADYARHVVKSFGGRER
jgi:hypothetical protein